MIILNFEKWTYAGRKYFKYERIFWEGLWTPFVHIKKRIRNWFGNSGEQDYTFYDPNR